MDDKKYALVPKVDYNEKLIRQQYEPMTPQEQYQLKMDALNEIEESGIDCSCPGDMPTPWKVLGMRADPTAATGTICHIVCGIWSMKTYALERLTEGSLKQWKPHREGEIPRQYPCPPDLARRGKEYCKSRSRALATPRPARLIAFSERGRNHRDQRERVSHSRPHQNHRFR